MSLTRQDIEDRMMDYLYEELSDDESALFEEGLRHHPDLMAEVDAHRHTRSAFARLPELDIPHLVQANILRDARRAAAEVGVAREQPRGLLARIASWMMQPAAATAMVGVLVAAIGLYVADKKMLSNEEVREDVYGPERVPSLTAAEPRLPEGSATKTATTGEESRWVAPPEEPAAAGAPSGGDRTVATRSADPATAEAPMEAVDKEESAGAALGDGRYGRRNDDRLSGKLDEPVAESTPKSSYKAGVIGKKAEERSKANESDQDARDVAGSINQKKTKSIGKDELASDGTEAPAGDMAQAMRPLPTANAAPSDLLAGDTTTQEAQQDLPPSIAGNVEQRAAAPGSDDNAVRDQFTSRGAPKSGPAAAAAVDQPAKDVAEKAPSAPAPATPVEAPQAFPQAAGEAPLLKNKMDYGPQQQQQRERKAAEIVYGGEDYRSTGSAAPAKPDSSLDLAAVTEEQLNSRVDLGLTTGAKGSSGLDASGGLLAGSLDGKDGQVFGGGVQALEGEQAPQVAEAQTVVTGQMNRGMDLADRAEATIDESKKAEDTGARGLMTRGDELLAAGSTSEAITAYEKAAKLDPSLSALARHKVALAYRRANRFLDALVSYDGLLQNYPRYMNRGAALREKFEVAMALGRLDKAERTLKDMETFESATAVEELRQRLYARRAALDAEGNTASKAAGAAKGKAAPARAKSMEAAEPVFDADVNPASETK